MRRRPMRLLVCILVASVIAAPAAAQDESFRTDTLAPGVFALIRPVRPDLVAISNHVVIVDDQGVTVVDAGLTPRLARSVLAEIRRLTDKPVRYVIDTHWHDDHVWGNSVFRDTFPDVQIIAHPFTHAVMRDSLEASLEQNRTDYSDAIARYDRALSTGRTSRGDTVTAELREAIETSGRMLRWFVPQMDEMRLTLPDILVEDALVLRRPGREIHVRWLGRGNTAGDLVVHLPRERIVATGDLIVSPVPYSFGSFLGDWMRTLERVKALAADVIVPGHGEPQRDHAYIDRLQGLMAFTLAEAHAGSERRLDVDSTRAAIDFTEWKERFTHGDPVLGTGFDAFWIQPAVERAYLEVTHALDDRQQQLVAQLGAIERSAWEAWKARDSTFFTRALETDARYVSGAGYATPSRLAHQTATFQCAVGTIELDHLEARALGEDGALLMGRALYDYTCAGNTTRAVSWFSTGFRRTAGDWRIVFHQETDAPKDGGG